jgi:hypothetical protein
VTTLFFLSSFYITTDGIKPQTNEEPTYIEPSTPGQDRSKAAAAKPPIVTIGSFIRYQWFFNRNTVTYSSNVLWPLYVGTL